MPTMLRIGTAFINLDRVTHVRCVGTVIAVYFSDKEHDYINYGDREAEALLAYLTEAATDVPAWHALKLDNARAVAVRHESVCTDPRGHDFLWDDASDQVTCSRCHRRGDELSGGAETSSPAGRTRR